MTAEGNLKSLWFVMGMVVGSVIFYLVTVGFVTGLFKAAGV